MKKFSTTRFDETSKLFGDKMSIINEPTEKFVDIFHVLDIVLI